MWKQISAKILPFLVSLLSTAALFAFDNSTPAASRFVPVAPCRAVDTRNVAGPLGGPRLAAGSVRSFALPNSGCGLPAGSLAYSLNITVVPSAPLGFLTIWPTGQAQPFVSTLNSPDGRIVANAAIVPAGEGGAVSIFVTDNTDVVIDVNGYFDSQNASALPFFPVAPCRLVDTRDAAGTLAGPALVAGAQRAFPVTASPCGLPASAAAYSLNATVVPAGPLGFLTLSPTGQAQPFVSSLNSPAGTTVANAALVPAGAGGSVNAYATDNTHLVLDTNGYFGPAGNGTPLAFFPLVPCRIADTRGAVGAFGGPRLSAGATRTFVIPQSACHVPGSAKAYSLNVTAIPTGALGFLTLWPSDRTRPLASTLNSPQGTVVANAALVPAATTDGSVSVFVTDAADVVLDINGYFAEAPVSPNSDFLLSVTPPAQTVTKGAIAEYTLTVTSVNGFTGPVDLSITAPDPMIQNAGFNPGRVNVPANGSVTATARVFTGFDNLTGAFTLTFQAQAGTTTRTQNAALVINPVTNQVTQITINNFAFAPTPVDVAAGTQVTWTNQQLGVNHTVVADGGAFSSTVLSSGQSFSTMPSTPGTYNYHCSIHPGMRGTLVVH